MEAWKTKERKEFLDFAGPFFFIGAAVYIAHYYFFDLPTGLEPKQHWFQFRASMTILCLATAVFYSSPLAGKGPYRLPALVTGVILCYFQARVTVWYPEAPWLYCSALILMISFVLHTSAVKSLVFASVATALQWPSLLEAGHKTPLLISNFAVTCTIILAMRNAYISNIRFFLLTQQNTESQRRNIELNIEFTDRLRSFIPQQIVKRLEGQLADGRTTVLQAVDDVLRPRKQNIACLFSDIRGFTEGSKELDTFIGDLVLPNIKACTHAVEDFGGIPRKIGDLIFAYYDEENQQANVLNSILSGFEIASINEEQNAGIKNGEIKRYILISAGEAIVGNIGGFDSSVEITALGSPVNFLARVDELTKNERIAKQLKNGDVVVSDEAHSILVQLELGLETKQLNLRDLDVQIRDFNDETVLYSVTDSDSNKAIIYECLQKLDSQQETKSDYNRGKAA